MSLAVTKVSDAASSFPTLEVEYEDLLTLQYWPDGRGDDGWIDCIGIVLEIYRRAGLGLPDPALNGGQIFEFQDLFESVSAADQLFDLIALERATWHVEVVIRYGLSISARQWKNVYTQRTGNLLRFPDVKIYRLKSEFIPT